ncbi:signal peptidase I [Enterococcus silesiacus]|uniref:Signal peptidase I n=2 Tax=Enterococcus silesiacus TaxID=332949 RepID=A0AA91G7V7_9ENTE|nr:signal peptidase I [Enterococcus silesiacus]OJG85806.1 signal peptidase I [Enterococcus silesiacus]
MKKATHKNRTKQKPKKQTAQTTTNAKKTVKRNVLTNPKMPSKKRKKKRNKKRRKMLLLFGEIGLTLLVTIVVVYLLSLFTFSLAKVEGYSMSDTLDDKDVVVINKLKDIKRFDLVYMKVPNAKDKSIRRIIACSGESVYYKNGQLFINEEEKEERFIADYKSQFEKDGMMFTEDFTLKTLTGKSTIPKGKYLVLGDNRPYATDSRYYQLVDEKEIIGTVEMRILPLHKLQKF